MSVQDQEALSLLWVEGNRSTSTQQTHRIFIYGQNHGIVAFPLHQAYLRLVKISSEFLLFNLVAERGNDFLASEVKSGHRIEIMVREDDRLV